jgi:peptidoglycan-associated lipoprotein
MNKSLLVVALSGVLMAGCSTTELVDSQPLNPPFPELASSVGDGSAVNLIAESDAALTGSGLSLGLNKLRGSAVLSQRSVYFDFNQYVVKDEFMEAIATHASYLSQHPDVRMVINGNADYRGSHEYNLSLGQKRAVAVKEALNTYGADDSQIETVSFGEEYANQECTGAQCGEDRRADIAYEVE